MLIISLWGGSKRGSYGNTYNGADNPGENKDMVLNIKEDNATGKSTDNNEDDATRIDNRIGDS